MTARLAKTVLWVNPKLQRGLLILPGVPTERPPSGGALRGDTVIFEFRFCKILKVWVLPKGGEKIN